MKKLLSMIGIGLLMASCIKESVDNPIGGGSAAPVIEKAYYIVGGASGDWAETAASKALKFNHSGKDVYEDPVFSIVIDAAEGDTWFAIGDDEACDAIANDNEWDKLFGTTLGNGKSGTSGSLDRRMNLSDDGSFCVPAGHKKIRVVINMMDYTYEITPLDFGEFFYEIGNESGWGISHALYDPASDGTYSGFYYLDGEYKFKPNADNWDDDLEYVDGTITSGTLSPSGDSNCPDPGAGFYKIDLDAGALTFNLTKIESVSIIGGFNDWSGDVEMTYNSAEGCWEVTTDAVSGEFKFRANHDWGINWGGDVKGLTQDGANISINPGTYTFKLYLSYDGAHHVTIQPDLNIADNIIGKWMYAERNGQPMVTNRKTVYTFVSPTKAYMSASLNTIPELGSQWNDHIEVDVAINGNKMTLISHPDERMTVVDESIITNIGNSDFTANSKVTFTVDGVVVRTGEYNILYEKVPTDYSAAVLGLWECTGLSGIETYNDANARLEFFDDGTYNYWRKNDAGEWETVASREFQDYFVDGTLLVTRWKNQGEDELREWWEIDNISDEKMVWTALRQNTDGSTIQQEMTWKKIGQK